MATVRIQVRRGTASQWTSTNPILAAGEMGVETDSNLFKFGNGTSTWTALSYANNSDVSIGEISQDAINNALSLGAGLTKSYNDGTNTIQITVDSDVIALKSYVDNAVDGIVNTADVTYVLQEDRGAVNGVASLNAQGKVPTSEIDLTVMATREYADYLQTQDLAALTIHQGTTLNVHGIADTSLLATDADVLDALNTAKSYTDTKKETIDNSINSLSTTLQAYADTKKAEAITAAESYGDSIGATAASFATGEVSAHNADTSDVHGIADTLALATKTYADDAADAAEAAAEVTANIKVSDHNLDTTNVHGISDTAELATKSYADTAEADAITAAGTAADTKIATAVAALTKSSVGLANVDNTADADKPVSTATQTALDLKAPKAAPTFTGTVTASADLVVDGNLTVNGTTFNASSTSITIEDNLVQLAHQNSGNSVDLGLVVAYNDGAAKHAGLARDVSDDKWRLFKGVTSEPSTTVNFAQGSLDTLAVSGLEATTVTVSSGVAFSDGTQTKEGVPSRTPIVQKTASYTLSALTERDNLIEVASGSATTVTIPADSEVNYPIGTSIDILQTSTGQVTIAGAGGVTVNATPGLKLRTQWSSASLLKRAANTWIVMGDLTA
jgi:hypothetical protein